MTKANHRLPESCQENRLPRDAILQKLGIPASAIIDRRQKALDRLIQDPLAVKILKGEFRERDPITIDSDGGELHFSHGTPEATEESWSERTLH